MRRSTPEKTSNSTSTVGNKKPATSTSASMEDDRKKRGNSANGTRIANSKKEEQKKKAQKWHGKGIEAYKEKATAKVSEEDERGNGSNGYEECNATS